MCPQCGSAAAVHSIEELAALARSRLGQPGQPNAAPPQQQEGWAAQPQAGPVGGWAGQPQAGPPPGPGQQPRSGPRGGGWQNNRSRSPIGSIGDAMSIEDDIAGAVLGAAAGFLGRAISRRVQNTVSQQVLPALAAKQEEMLRAQIAIAERHPDLRACLNDHVVFLAGGSRAVPMPNIASITVEQSDALVNSLRNG